MQDLEPGKVILAEYAMVSLKMASLAANGYNNTVRTFGFSSDIVLLSRDLLVQRRQNVTV